MIKPYRYIALDFETTGLDPQKDEPIQVGIVEFDENFSLVETYESLIRPEKEHKELRSIVTYLTGFTLDDLEEAPRLETVRDEIADFFTGQVVLVGQNISFDLAVLKQFLMIEPVTTIDTYPLSKAILHFAPSYALDVTAELIPASYDLPKKEAGYHDALTDSLASYKVFRYFIERLTDLRHKYVLLDYVLENSVGDLATIIKRTQKNYSFSQKKLFFPPLKKEVKRQKRRIKDDTINLDHPTHTLLDASATGCKQLLEKIDFQQKNLVLAFQTRAKMAHAANICKELGVVYTTMHDRAVFDPDRVDAFLQKNNFNDQELLFVTKYFSQYQKEYGIIDTNSVTDYKIVDALTDNKTSDSPLPILTTHRQLRTNQHKLHDEQQVLFFDHARWYQSFRRWKYRPVDPLHGVYLFDRLHYVHQIDGNEQLAQQLAKLQQQYTVFIGVLGTETDKFFRGFPERRQEIETILDNPRYPNTTKLFKQLKQHIEDLTDDLPAEDVIEITGLIDQLQEVLDGLCEVEKRMYDGDKWWYRFHQVDQFVDYSEFLTMAEPGRRYFISNFQTKNEDAIKLPKADTKQLPLTVEKDSNRLIKQIKKQTGNRYVVSTAKHVSKDLFDQLVDHGIQNTHTVLAENITGGRGKNCFMAQQANKPLIIIGGYTFYFKLLAKKIAISGLYLYHLYGPMKQQMVADMQRYTRG